MSLALMHVPDGLIDPTTAVVTWLCAAAATMVVHEVTATDPRYAQRVRGKTAVMARNK